MTKLVVPCGKSKVSVKKEDQIIIPGMHEANVTVEEYEAARKVIKKRGNSRQTKTEYPLKSLVFCGNCGRHMRRTKSANMPRFKCTHGRYDRESLCNQVSSLLEKELEKMVFDAIRNMIRLVEDKQVRSKLSWTKA